MEIQEDREGGGNRKAGSTGDAKKSKMGVKRT